MSMSHRLMDEFLWCDFTGLLDDEMADTDGYGRVVDWAARARGTNPRVFDMLTAWLLDDAQWGNERLVENERILMQEVLARFREQNARLRTYLSALSPSGVVNTAVFPALDRFDAALSGVIHDTRLQEAVTRMFADFSVMQERSIRVLIAGQKTGPTGTDSVDTYGYINMLKDCDAGVQWTLFMPVVVERHQKGFKVESFEYLNMPAMRFIGRSGDDLSDVNVRKQLFSVLDDLSEYRSDFSHDILFMHHYGLGVDVGPQHHVWGRFMQANTPVPDGFLYFDLVPYHDGKVGPPYISQFAYAIFSGDVQAMHQCEGYDCDAMYDVTRNIMLSQGVSIPYPGKYWIAEVFLAGCDKPSTAYLFSAEI
jgi:hypothetical protein